MKTRVILILALALMIPGAAFAQNYSFNVHAKFVNVSFESRMEIEDILGTTNTIGGWLKLNGDKGGEFRLEVPVDSLETGIDMRDEHLRSPMWLDAKSSPLVVFEGRKVKPLGGDQYEVSGTFTVKGVARPLTVTVQARRIPAEKAAKLGLGEENWVRVRGEFKVRLSDFGIQRPEMTLAKVNDEWTVRVSLFAKEEK